MYVGPVSLTPTLRMERSWHPPHSSLPAAVNAGSWCAVRTRAVLVQGQWEARVSRECAFRSLHEPK